MFRATFLRRVSSPAFNTYQTIDQDYQAGPRVIRRAIKARRAFKARGSVAIEKVDRIPTHRIGDPIYAQQRARIRFPRLWFCQLDQAEGEEEDEDREYRGRHRGRPRSARVQRTPRVGSNDRASRRSRSATPGYSALLVLRGIFFRCDRLSSPFGGGDGTGRALLPRRNGRW